MKCPLCQTRELQVDVAEGYTKDIVKECNTCSTIWSHSLDHKIKIIYDGFNGKQ
jgi:uncharacterized Zn finger protein